jgi:DNA recombination-mediator protein A/DprA-like N-terminal HHH domain
LSNPGQTEDPRLDWLRLIRSENIGPRTFHDLVRQYGGVYPALMALPDLARRGGLKRSPRICSREQAKAELEAAQLAGVGFLTIDEPEYPARLRMIDDPPPVLAVRGRIDALARPLIGIVGSRNASAAGIKFAQRIARDLGDAGFTVVSGLARGIDAAAHRASLGTGTVASRALSPQLCALCCSSSRLRGGSNGMVQGWYRCCNVRYRLASTGKPIHVMPIRNCSRGASGIASSHIARAGPIVRGFCFRALD